MTQQRHKHYQCIRAFADGWKIVDICGVVLTNQSFYDYEEYFTVPDSEGWLPWYATEDSVCPVDGGVLVNIGGLHNNVACELDWSNGFCAPITRYRIVKEVKTPRAKRTLVKTIKVFSDGSTEEE